MKKLLLFTAALLCSASMWADAPVVEGPWTQIAMKSHACAKSANASIAFAELNNTHWAEDSIFSWLDDDGVGFSIVGKSDAQSKIAIFSTYKDEVVVPSYSSMTLTWKYHLRSMSTKHHSSTCLYALPGTEDIDTLHVDFSNHHDTQAGAEYLLDCLVNREQDNKVKKASEKTVTFVFDNLSGTDEQTQAWYLLLAHVVASGDAKSGLHEWGSFKNANAQTAWTYRTIITFDKNDNAAVGAMDAQTIDGTGKLQANEFTRADYVFAGWATSPNGDVVYPDGDVITVTESSKGPRTLYAKWTEWGQGKKEGPWILLEMKTDSCDRNLYPSVTFNALNGKQWPGTIYNVGDNLGAGYTYGTVSPAESKLGVFSTYMYEANVPSYSSMTLNWRYKVSSKSTGHYSSVCLYIVQDTYDSIANRLAVDYSNEHKSTVGVENLLTSPFINREKNGKQLYTSEQTASFTFDNIEGNSPIKDTCFMMMTYVLESGGAKTGLNENGFFRSISADTTWTYFKYITFDKNADDAGGLMTGLYVENSGNLPANSFRRSGYTFQGWAISPDGQVIYADKAAVTATANSKGLVTLYAKWAEGGDPVNPNIEGPWTYNETRTGISAKSENETIRFVDLDNAKWDGTVGQWQENYGIGSSFAGTSPANSKMGIFSTYEATATVPPYTCMALTWSFNLYSKSTKHYATVCLYGGEYSYDNVKSLSVPFTNRYDKVQPAVEPPLLAWFFNNKYDSISRSNKTISITFDNRQSSEQQTKTSYMIMAYMLGSADSETTQGVNEAGSFQSLSIDTTWIYCKTITFDKNADEAAGAMATQYINNSGRLHDNTFTRAGYTFQGWATEQNGQVIYEDGAEIAATATDRGPITLYAKWAEGEGATTETEGPWTQNAVRSMACAKSAHPSISFDEMDNTKWSGTYLGWRGNDGMGYTYRGESSANSKMGIFSTYRKEVAMPAYSSMKLTWTFKVNSKSSKHHSTTCLYAYPDYTYLMNLAVDFSNHYDSKTGAKYLLTRAFVNKEQAGRVLWTPEQTAVFEFDNRRGSTDVTKSWYLLMTHVMASGENGKSDLYEWGAFMSVSVQEEWSYYKVVSLHANGGAGMMTGPIIENAGNLPANTFVRGGYTFAGWATTPNGNVEYADKAAITADSDHKGLLDLYAVWTPNEYAIDYELNGGTADNPASYTENVALALTDPTKADYTFLGWTGSNGSVPQTAVAIAKGSKGVKSYTAHWMSNAVATTINLINAIGTVEHTAESKAKIDAARAAYDALGEDEQAFVSNYSTLTDAEAAYAAFEPSTIRFMELDGKTQIGDDQQIAVYYPKPPVISGYTFQYWQIVAKDLPDGTIRLQAVYISDPTDIDETVVNRQSSNRKFIKDGNLYILKEEFIYTINGQKVK